MHSLQLEGKRPSRAHSIAALPAALFVILLPVASAGAEGKQGTLQKSESHGPPPGIYNCLSNPKAGPNTQTLSSANPIPQKNGQYVGKIVYGRDGEQVGKVESEVSPQGCDVTAVLADIGGFIGLGGKQAEIPMQDLKVRGR